MKSYLSIFFLFLVLLVLYLRNFCQFQDHTALQLCFQLEFYGFLPDIYVFDTFSVNFSVYYEIGVHLYSFVGRYAVVSASFVNKTILSPLNVLSTLVKNQLATEVWVYFQTLISVPLVSVSVFTPMSAVCCCFSCVRLFVAPWTVAHQAPLSLGFSRQEYYLPCPPPGHLPNPEIEPMSYVSCIGRWVLYHSCHLGTHVLITVAL